MKQIFDSLKELICPYMVSKASHIVGEKESDVSAASTSIIASLLGVMLKRGDTPQIRNILKEAGNLNLLGNAENICQEKPTEDQRKIGDDFLEHLLGDDAASFTNPIAEHTGISKVATNRMVSMIAPLVAGYLGNKLSKGNTTLPVLLNQISEEKNQFAPYIPSKLATAFGIGSVLKTSTTNVVKEKPKKGNSWITWLILIILLLLLFFWWRSCNNSERDAMTYRSESVISSDTTTNRNASQAATRSTTTTNNADRTLTEITLANGTKINAYKGGTEEKMINYLNSDEYKNAKEADLKDKWFEFDNISFEFNSGSQLMDHSQQQINNIATILKSYPNAKIRIAGFADKRGTEEVNMEISKERAKTVEKMLDDKGIASQIARTEGHGEENAKYPENAPDSQRAKDRDIALRFVK